VVKGIVPGQSRRRAAKVWRLAANPGPKTESDATCAMVRFSAFDASDKVRSYDAEEHKNNKTLEGGVPHSQAITPSREGGRAGPPTDPNGTAQKKGGISPIIGKNKGE
jgi:hypothetical protein